MCRSLLAGVGFVVAVPAVGVLAAACSGGGCSSGPVPTDGTLSGVLQAVGGPAPGNPRPLPGTIQLRDQNGRAVSSAIAGADGKFSVRVAAGTYVVTGRSPLYQGGRVDCQATGPVSVSSGKMTRVVVSCQLR